MPVEHERLRAALLRVVDLDLEVRLREREVRVARGGGGHDDERAALRLDADGAAAPADLLKCPVGVGPRVGADGEEQRLVGPDLGVRREVADVDAPAGGARHLVAAVRPAARPSRRGTPAPCRTPAARPPRARSGRRSSALGAAALLSPPSSSPPLASAKISATTRTTSRGDRPGIQRGRDGCGGVGRTAAGRGSSRRNVPSRAGPAIGARKRDACRHPDCRTIRAMATTPRRHRRPRSRGTERDAPFTTLSGEPIEPLYTEADLPADPSAIGAARASTRSRAASTRRCTAGGCGRCASSPASAPPRRPTSASATCSTTARPGSRPRSTCRR